MLAASLSNHLLNRDGGAGGCVFLMNVMTLEDLPGVVVTQGYGGGPCDVEEQIHADRKVCGIDESGGVRFDQIANSGDLSVPSRRAHDHVLARRPRSRSAHLGAKRAASNIQRASLRQAVLGG